MSKDRVYPIPEDDARHNERMVERFPESGTRSIKYMGPDEYHKEVGRPPPYDSSISKLKKDISENGLKQMPWLKYDDKDKVTSQEGRHRVEALKSLGYTRIPVVIHHPVKRPKDT